MRIRSLGAFAVFRGDALVPATAWQSKKARDVLKILVGRLGHPITRDALMEALWPDQDPQRTSNRLSVALSIARSVLDPDRRFASDWFIRADRYAARLELQHVDVDVVDFLDAAADGLSSYRAGHGDEASRLLEYAAATYTGDFLEEDLYEDWAIPLREQAQAAYDAVGHALRQATGRHEAARFAHLPWSRVAFRPFPATAPARLAGPLAVPARS